MRVHVTITQRYALTLRGHGDEAVRRLEQFSLDNLPAEADLLEVTATYATPNGNFTYELAAPVVLMWGAQTHEQLAAFNRYTSTDTTETTV